MVRLAKRQTDGQTGINTDIWTDRPTDRQTDRWSDRQTDRHKEPSSSAFLCFSLFASLGDCLLQNWRWNYPVRSRLASELNWLGHTSCQSLEVMVCRSWIVLSLQRYNTQRSFRNLSKVSCHVCLIITQYVHWCSKRGPQKL